MPTSTKKGKSAKKENPTPKGASMTIDFKDPEPTKGLYEKWRYLDVASILLPAVKSGGLKVSMPDGRFYAIPRFDLETPWHFVNIKPKDCFRCHEVLFSMAGVLPSSCLECWKVVVAPRTLSEMWKLKGLMEQYRASSKLGIETREYVPRLYGAYFYNDSLEEGQAKYKTVRAMVDLISPDISVILKRGCTEFERKFGASDQWENMLSQASLDIEAEILRLVDPVVGQPKPEHLSARTFRTWVEWAYQHGDPTWKEFMGDPDAFPLVTKTVTYHESVSGETT